MNFYEFALTLARSIDLASVVLMFLAVFGLWEGRKSSLDWNQAFQDASGKTSSSRICQFIAMTLISWYFVFATVNAIRTMHTPDDVVKVLGALSWLAMGYAGLYSGSKIIESIAAPLIAKWAGVTPAQTTSNSPER